MFVWNSAWNGGKGVAVNLALADSVYVTGSDSSWGIQATIGGNGVTITGNGHYSTQAAATAALLELLQLAGYVDLP